MLVKPVIFYNLILVITGCSIMFKFQSENPGYCPGHPGHPGHPGPGPGPVPVPVKIELLVPVPVPVPVR